MSKSPFRYPGSKARLLDWITPKIPRSEKFFDLFCGGASVALEIARRDQDTEIYLNDADPFIADFWTCIIDSYFLEALTYQINTHNPSVEEFKEIQKFRLGPPSVDTVKNAFAALVCNRQAFNGIAGSGPLGGYMQQSKYKIDCRWSAKNIVKNINACARLLNFRTIVYSKHFKKIFSQYKNTSNFFYLDPPYYNKGNALYNVQMSEIDHIELRNCLVDRENWLLSYDGCEQIKNLYDFADIEEREQHSFLAREKRKEILISPKPISFVEEFQNPVQFQDQNEV